MPMSNAMKEAYIARDKARCEAQKQESKKARQKRSVIISARKFAKKDFKEKIK